MIERFNLRAYALWIKGGKILLSNECINDFSFTKFPGGGVEMGEGIKDALIRELKEETGIQVQDSELAHFYTTDFFQQSAFNPQEQIVSIYYLLSHESEIAFSFKDESTSKKRHELRLTWQTLTHFSKTQLTFPIDRIVYEKLLEMGLIF